MRRGKNARREEGQVMENTDEKERAAELLQGAYDLHVHTKPSAFQRELSDWELLQDAEEAQMAGVLIKTHYGCTADRATVVNLKGSCRAKAYGALALNWPTGGLNPYAVENCLHQGGILIWMPTRDAKHCLTYGNMPGDFFARPGITVLDEKGKLLPVVYDIMDIVKKYGAYLGTGHLSLEESVILCREGRARKVNMILTHPEWSRTMADGAVQAELSSLGVIIEKNWVNIAEKTVSIEKMAKNIRMAGVDHTYIATDRGQKGFERPVEGMRRFICALLNAGFTKEEIMTMTHTVPSYIAAREPLYT